MNWIEIILKTTTQGSDIMAQLLYEAGASGAVIEDPADIQLYQRQEGEWDYIDESITDRMDEEVLVKGYLPDDEKLHDRLGYIRDRVQYLLHAELEGLDLGTGTLEFRSVKEEDWANGWKKYYKPFRAGEKIVIKPSWEDYQEKDGDLIIEMDPGMAFGTGTHETTMMCIQLAEKYVKPGMQIIDVGCGTGILSIAAGKLGAQSVLAVDLDPVSVKVTRENVKLNQMENVISAMQGNLLDQVNRQADIVMANIIADIIMRLAAPVRDFLQDGGIFIASGIIKDREREVREELERAGYRILDTLSMGEWVALACES